MEIPKDILQKIEVVYGLDKHIPLKVKVNHIEEECDVCGEMVKNRKTFIRKVRNPVPRWSETCNLCKKSYNKYNDTWVSEPELRQYLHDKFRNR